MWCNLSTSVKAAPLMISGALNGSSGCLWYAGFWQYIIYICNLSISVKAAPLMVSGALNGPSGCLWYDEGITKLSIVSYIIGMLWYAGCQQYITYTCNLHISVNTACPIISRSLNRSAWRCPDGLLSLIYQSYQHIWYTIGRLHVTAFQWSKVLKRKLGKQLIISQTTRWSI